MKTIFFFSHSKQIKWYAVFARAFKVCVPDANLVLFVHGEDDFKYATKFRTYDRVIDLISGFKYDQSKYPDKEQVSYKITKLEDDLNLSFFWEDIKVDRWIRAKNNSNFTIKYLNYSFEIIHNAYLEYNPILGFGESTMAVYRLAHRMFDRDRKPYIGPMSNRYSSRFYFEDDWLWKWHKCINNYYSYLQNGIPEDISNIIDDQYENLVIRGIKPTAFEDFKKTNQPGYVTLRKDSLFRVFKIIRGLSKLKSEYFSNNVRYSIIESSFFMKIKRVANNYYNHYKYSRLTTSSFEIKDSYSVYFLHFQPEYTVDSLGKFYHDQVNLISNIASSLPSNIKLFVKEHPGMVGLRESTFYSKILEIPNVELLDHDIDSQLLIKNSKLVFSIVGTVGLEATFFNIPSIMFGEYAFSDVGTSTFCGDIWKLESLIRSKLQENIGYDSEKLSKTLLAAKYSASYPGKIPISDNTIDPFYSDEEQYKLILKAVKEELETRKLI